MAKKPPFPSACAAPRAPAVTPRPDVANLRLRIAGACLLLLNVAATAPVDPLNPTCPKRLNWSTYPQMRFTLDTSNGRRVLMAEGMLDQDVPAKLDEALKTNAPIDEIWIRSPGGDAR